MVFFFLLGFPLKAPNRGTNSKKKTCPHVLKRARARERTPRHALRDPGLPECREALKTGGEGGGGGERVARSMDDVRKLTQTKDNEGVVPPKYKAVAC